MILDTTPLVDEISQIHFEGNVIPTSWYSQIKFESGATDLQAIVILSEICYWYRRTEIFDPEVDQIIGFKKKFHRDKLQRSYQTLGDKFGFSKRQTKEAIDRLIKLNLVTREFRSIITETGRSEERRVGK